jgi:hypothetical protein
LNNRHNRTSGFRVGYKIMPVSFGSWFSKKDAAFGNQPRIGFCAPGYLNLSVAD